MSSSGGSTEEEKQAFLDHGDVISTQHRPKPNTHYRVIWLLIILTLISWSASLYLLLSRKSWPRPFPTDLKSMWSAIEYEERSFGGGLNYDEKSKKVVWEIDEKEPQYFGLPSPALDASWSALMRGRTDSDITQVLLLIIFTGEFAVLTPEESEPYIPLGLKPLHRDGQYHFEPTVMHNLHCLNAVRMHIDHEYYESHGHAHSHNYTNILPQQPEFARIHMDHCLDQLRQALMCAGDLAPAPLYTWSGFPLAFGKSALHTCKKWEPIREWYDGRIEEYGAIQEDGTIVPKSGRSG